TAPCASPIPPNSCEAIVMGGVAKGTVALDLARFGFEEDDLVRFKKVITTPYGMILVTGPTGSGKSTTLYAAIATINNPDINIVTAEDPVEFNIAGVNQVLVREDIGYNFAAALRAFL